jgi:hypothetical protein
MCMWSESKVSKLALPCVAGLLAAGCFDVELVNPGTSGAQSIKVDDFEDGDSLPSSSLFGIWECYAFQDVQPPPKCSLTAGIDNGVGLSIEFVLQIPAGYTDLIGVGYGMLRSPNLSDTQQPLDGTSWHRIDFDAKFIANDPESDDVSNVRVQLPCIALRTSSAPSRFAYSIERTEPLGRDWSHHSVAIEQFAPPAWSTVRIDRHECLAVLDGVFFNIQAPSSLNDGHLASGSMTIDNVFIQ